MKRDPSWPTMLASFVETRRSQPFAWGSNDCCLFASDWIMLCTGFDPAEKIRGTYSTALGASRILRSLGGVQGVVTKLGEPLGLQPVNPQMAQRGDLTMQDNGQGSCLGIVLGQLAAFVGKNGLVFLPYSSAACWKV